MSAAEASTAGWVCSCATRTGARRRPAHSGSNRPASVHVGNCRGDHASFKNSVSLLNDVAVIDFLPFDLVSIEFSAGVLQGFVKGGKRR